MEIKPNPETTPTHGNQTIADGGDDRQWKSWEAQPWKFKEKRSGFLVFYWSGFVVSFFFVDWLPSLWSLPVNLWNLSLRDSIFALIFIEIESLILDLLQWNRVQHTRDVSFLNRLKTMLTNETIWNGCYFEKKKILTYLFVIFCSYYYISSVSLETTKILFPVL